MSNQEDQILQKVKELLDIDLSKLKYVEIPHVLFLVSKIVYEDRKLDPRLQKNLISKIVCITVDKSDMPSGIKIAIKQMIPGIIDKYIEIDNGSSKINIRTYGRMGRMWIKIRSYLDHKILGI
jgi:hypothetical protein